MDFAYNPPVSIEGAHKDEVTSLVFTPSEEYLWSTCLDKKVRLWNPFTQTLIREFQGPNAGITNVSSTRDNIAMACTSADGLLHVYDLNTGTPVRKLNAHTKSASACSFAPTEELIATGGADGSIKLWDMRSPNKGSVGGTHRASLLTLSGFDGNITCASFGGNSSLGAAEGALLWAGGEDGTVRNFDFRTGKFTIDQLPSPVASLSVLEGGVVVAGCSTGRAYVLSSAVGDRLNSVLLAQTETGEGVFAENSKEEGLGRFTMLPGAESDPTALSAVGDSLYLVRVLEKDLTKQLKARVVVEVADEDESLTRVAAAGKKKDRPAIIVAASNAGTMRFFLGAEGKQG